jgi:hypothetical protein
MDFTAFHAELVALRRSLHILTDGALIHTELAIRALADHVDLSARREELHAAR